MHRQMTFCCSHKSYCGFCHVLAHLSYFSMNHMLWYSLEVPKWGDSNEHPQHNKLCFCWGKKNWPYLKLCPGYHGKSVEWFWLIFSPQWGDSNEYPQDTFGWRKKSEDQIYPLSTVKPALKATFIKESTVKSHIIWIPLKSTKCKYTCIKQAPLSSHHF